MIIGWVWMIIGYKGGKLFDSSKPKVILLGHRSVSTGHLQQCRWPFLVQFFKITGKEVTNLEEIEVLKGQLDNVRAAIMAIETGAQDYQIANRRITKADLATLYKRETSLKKQIAQLSGNDLYFAELGRV